MLERLSDQRVLEISLEKPIVSLLDEIGPLWNLEQPPVAVCVYGLEHSLREQGQDSPVLGRLNHDRDLLRQSVPAALLIWLPDFALDYVARGAPDFWAWRSGVYEFQTDSTLWQAESNAAFSDHDAVSIDSLSREDKQSEITRSEELLRTSQTLTAQGKQAKQTTLRLLNRLGFLYGSLGNQDKALDRYQQSLRMAKALDDRAGEGVALNNLSTIYQRRGEYDDARRYLEEALAIQRASGDRAGEGAALYNLSQIYQDRGDYDAALRNLTESLDLFRALGDRAGEGVALNSLATIYHARGDRDAALRYLKEALDIQRAIGDRAGEGVTLNNLSQIHGARGDRDTALRYLEESLAIRRAIGDRAGEGATLNNLSQIYKARGDYGTALRYLEQSLALRRAIDDRAGLCSTLFNMGQIHLKRGERQQGFACWIEAYKTAKKIGLAEALTHLERLAKQLGGDGLEYWERLARSTPGTRPQTKRRRAG